MAIIGLVDTISGELAEVTTAGYALLDDVTVVEQRTTLGLGTAAVVDTGVLVGQIPIRPADNALSTDIISEITTGTGITIDGVLLKDNTITGEGLTILRDGTSPLITINNTGADPMGGYIGFKRNGVSVGAVGDMGILTGNAVNTGTGIVSQTSFYIIPGGGGNGIVQVNTVGQLLGRSGSLNTQPQFAFIDDHDTGIRLYDINKLSITTGGVDAMIIDVNTVSVIAPDMTLNGKAVATEEYVDENIPSGGGVARDPSFWSARGTNGVNNSWQGICWSPELAKFVAVAANGTNANRIMTSLDGSNWTTQTTAINLNAWRSVCWSPTLNMFCTVANSGTSGARAATSPTGEDGTWTQRTTPPDNAGWNSICWSPTLGLFCAVASSGTYRVMTSADGVTWTAQTAAEANSWQGVCWSADLSLFCAVASDGTNQVMTSPDGVTWTARTAPVIDGYAITWAHGLGLFCAVGQGSGERVMTSPDGVTWITRTAAAANAWTSVAWSEELGVLCAVGSTGTGDRVMTSTNSITWTAEASTAEATYQDVCWSPSLGIFCGVASGGGSRLSLVSRPDLLFNRPETDVTVYTLDNTHPSSLGSQLNFQRKGILQGYISTKCTPRVDTSLAGLAIVMPTGMLDISVNNGANWHVSVGNTILDCALKNDYGLKLNATPGNPGSQVLDCYYEGTWTPVITSSGTQPTYVASTAAGYYTRIGNRVLFDLAVVISSVSVVGTGDLIVSLPVAGVGYQALTVGYEKLTLAAGTIQLTAFTNNNASVSFAQTINAADIVMLPITAIVAGSNIRLSGSYRV